MKIFIASRGVAENIMKNNQDITHIVSIGADEPRQSPPKSLQKYAAQKLRLEFFDISCEKRKNMNGPSEKDINKLILFYQEALKTENPTFLIHCLAGKSRSVAAGLILLRMIYKDEKKAYEELAKIASNISPNTRMLDIADNILKNLRA